MFRYLGPLAGHTYTSPKYFVSVHSRPHETFANHTMHSSGAHVRKLMVDVEDLTRPCIRQQRPRLSCRHVNDQLYVSIGKLTPNYRQRGVGVGDQSLCSPVDGLLFSHIDVVYHSGENTLHVRDTRWLIYRCAGQCISNYIVGAWNVTNVGGELGNETEMSLLTRRQLLRNVFL